MEEEEPEVDYGDALNLPEQATFLTHHQSDNGTFQLNVTRAEEDAVDHKDVGTPKDQVVTAVKAFEQVALIVSLYYKAKYGIPILPILELSSESLPNFHLENE